MEIVLARDTYTNESTTGRLYVNGDFFGYALEDYDRGLASTMPLDEVRAKKVKGKTAIPAGRYAVRATWSPRYGRTMPEVCDVPGYKGIRIHSGNDADDTEGCILPGKTRARNRVYTSAKYAEWLEKHIMDALGRGEPVWFTVRRD